MWTYQHTDELYHYGVLGMRWGVKKNDKSAHRSTSLKAAAARRANKKVDKGFDKWKESTKNRDDAIELGKKVTAAKMAYENDKTDKGLKSAYKTVNKEYKTALKKNTTYQKGVVRQEVGRDASRKYLSAAKKVKKQLTADPANKQLQKRYNDLMSKHDIERADARRATSVSAKRSAKKASIKRTMTMTTKAVAATAAVSVGMYAVNKYTKGRVSSQFVSGMTNTAKKGKEFLGYMY